MAANAVANGAVPRGGSTSPAPAWPAGATRSGCSSGSRARTGRCRQFMHGEQGALICTAKIVETVPWIDAKYYAATQVMDEARHVEVFAKYLDDKLSGHYPINAHLAAAARRHHQRQPLGHDLPGHADHGRGPGPGRLRLHAPDDDRTAAEAAAALRHERRGPPRGLRRAEPAGVLRRALGDAEIRERQEFAFEAAVRMRDRFLQQEVWEPHGRADVKEIVAASAAGTENARPFQTPAVLQDRPQLQEARTARRRRRLAAPAVHRARRRSQFEDWADTGEEYEVMQATGSEAVA